MVKVQLVLRCAEIWGMPITPTFMTELERVRYGIFCPVGANIFGQIVLCKTHICINILFNICTNQALKHIQKKVYTLIYIKASFLSFSRNICVNI